MAAGSEQAAAGASRALAGFDWRAPQSRARGLLYQPGTAARLVTPALLVLR
ncbi:MAG: hypothetical protein JO047_04670 [Alphaproteobacteria bacterium]|nr:hypothetical protein [Alphaproteobacteria bacterium]